MNRTIIVNGYCLFVTQIQRGDRRGLISKFVDFFFSSLIFKFRALPFELLILLDDPSRCPLERETRLGLRFEPLCFFKFVFSILSETKNKIGTSVGQSIPLLPSRKMAKILKATLIFNYCSKMIIFVTYNQINCSFVRLTLLI